MQAENATSAAGSADHQHHGRAGVLAIYLIGVVAVFASAVILTVVLNASAFFWPMALLGAVIIVALLSAAVLPALRQNSLPEHEPPRSGPVPPATR